MDTVRIRKYLIITFLITWGCWWGEALLTGAFGMDLTRYPRVLFFIGGFGPTIAACLCMEKRFSLKTLKQFIFDHEKGTLWILGVFAALEILTFGLASREWIASVQGAPVLRTAIAAVVFLEATLFFGGNEELGWRGTLQPELEKKLPAPVASLITGVIWVTWHLPLWFIKGDSHQSMSFLAFALLGLLLSFWLGALRKKTKSVFFCMVLHGLTNTLLGVLAIKYNAILACGLCALTALSFWLMLHERKASNAGIEE